MLGEVNKQVTSPSIHLWTITRPIKMVSQHITLRREHRILSCRGRGCKQIGFYFCPKPNLGYQLPPHNKKNIEYKISGGVASY